MVVGILQVEIHIVPVGVDIFLAEVCMVGGIHSVEVDMEVGMEVGILFVEMSILPLEVGILPVWIPKLLMMHACPVVVH